MCYSYNILNIYSYNILSSKSFNFKFFYSEQILKTKFSLVECKSRCVFNGLFEKSVNVILFEKVLM